MHFLDLTLPEPAANLALDEALLLEAEAGRGDEVLRVWEWPSPCVVLGAGCKLVEDVDQAACAADGIPILRRASGGGTVLLGAGCLCYSLVLSQTRTPLLSEIRSSYCVLLKQLQAALAGVTSGIELAGISDLAVADRKFSGNAQQRKRNFLLHHGTLLYGFELASVGRYLHFPTRQPEYRGHRAHGDFLMNLSVDARALVRVLRWTWLAEAELQAWPQELVGKLLEEKYDRLEWVRRR